MRQPGKRHYLNENSARIYELIFLYLKFFTLLTFQESDFFIKRYYTPKLIESEIIKKKSG